MGNSNTLIDSWDGAQYSLKELLEFCDKSNEYQEPIEFLMDADGATPPAIIRSLIYRIRDLEYELQNYRKS